MSLLGKVRRSCLLQCYYPDSAPTLLEGPPLLEVDSRSVFFCSVLCYSADRQLSLDLVNVGRQRLDFLPMLEHSGTYRENPTHTGAFAQEIITLVHQVKGWCTVMEGLHNQQPLWLPVCLLACVCREVFRREGDHPERAVLGPAEGCVL